MKTILRLIKYMIVLNAIMIIIIMGVAQHNRWAMMSQMYELGSITLQSFRAVRPMFWTQQGVDSPMMQEFMEQFSAQSTVQNFFMFDSGGEIIYVYQEPPEFLVSTKLPSRLIYKNKLVLYDSFVPFKWGGHGYGRNQLPDHNGRMSGHGMGMMQMEPEEITACIVIDATKLVVSRRLSFLGIALGLIIQAVLIFLYFRCKKQLHIYEESEKRLRLIEQEATTGRLAAILAHEIKNPLSSMRGLISYSIKKSDQDIVVESLEKSVDEIDRLSGIVNSFLAFGKPFELSKSEISILALIEKMLYLFSYDIKAKKITVDVSGGDFSIIADEDKILQAFVNVLVNALEAAPSGSIVRIVKNSSERSMAVVNDLEQGESAEGGRFFEPFFTTKSNGSGLGLAISKKIMDMHNFNINIEEVDPFTVKFSFSKKGEK